MLLRVAGVGRASANPGLDNRGTEASLNRQLCFLYHCPSHIPLEPKLALQYKLRLRILTSARIILFNLIPRSLSCARK